MFKQFALFFLSFSIFAQSETFWWNNNVFYEIFVRSFYDSNADGVGDIRGLIEKLDYLNDGNPDTDTDLGIKGIWLMPINQSPSYHGYDVVDYKSIDNEYGTMDDFKELLDSADARGIKIIIDYVMNHTSNQHPWFVSSLYPQSEYRDWYIWEPQNPGYPGPWGQQVWHFKNAGYYFGLFWSGMPDLNYYNPDVKEALFDAAKFWIDTIGVAGFRLDAIRHLFEDGEIFSNVPETFEFLQEFNTFYKNLNPDVFTVGEVWDNTANILPYVDGTKIDFCFEFDLAESIINAVTNYNPGSLNSTAKNIFDSYPYLQFAPFLTNHDQDRVFSRFGSNIQQMKLAASLYLTMPGIPFIYYGEEIGMIGTGAHENIRTPMQWNAGNNAGFTNGNPWQNINSNYTTNNVFQMTEDPNSLWNTYRKLIRARNSSEALRLGDYRIGSSSTARNMVFARSTENEMVLVVNNFLQTSLNFPVYNLSSSRLPEGTYAVKELLSNIDLGQTSINTSGGLINFSPNYTIPALGTALYEFKPISVSVKDEKSGKYAFLLEQNYPNPFNPSTKIKFSIPAQNHVKLYIFNSLGEKIAELLNDIIDEGYYTIEFQAENLSSGIYFYSIQAGQFRETKSMILIK